MAIQFQPSRIPEPFAGSGTKNTIPATNATPSASQAASWASGFPLECSQPISAGGCPVPRNDFNGVLNQLSQDFAFRQDGGIWEWSALADYDVQRIVRGSDGLLYRSVAQSGPGFAAGPQNPALDDGTYWASPYVKTMAPSDFSNAAASTAWVNSWYLAQVAITDYYVDPSSGSDANAGTTPSTPLKTVAGFYARLSAASFVPSSVTVHLASGSYGERLANEQTKAGVIFSGPETGFASFTECYIYGSLTRLRGRIQLSDQLRVSRGAFVSLDDGLYLNFNNLMSISHSIFVFQNGIVSVPDQQSITIAYTGTNSFTIATVDMTTGGRFAIDGSYSTVTGTVTGKRYQCTTGSGISSTGSTTFFPGSAAGTVDSTSYYS